jgi:hypothetical protein
VRIHLGHHFYGAGNLGDDFMLAGFLAVMRTLAPQATYTCCVPFPLEPLRQRFPAIEWLPYDEAVRARCIGACDAWLGLGGSPFQHALSRWFIDHLSSDARECERAGKPMFFLGVGVQTTDELSDSEVRRVCAQASAIWTRDAASAERLTALPARPPIEASADLAHLYFKSNPPPAAIAGRLTVVANFDYGSWPGQAAFLDTVGDGADTRPPFASSIMDRVWLAQESRPLPGAERALYAALPPAERDRWRLVIPDLEPTPAISVPAAMARWPSGQWLVTARFHAAFSGAWSGSSIVILGINEKLRGAARELGCPLLAIDADETAVREALRTSDTAAAPAVPAPSLLRSADQALASCAAFVRAVPRSAVAPGH